MTLWQVGSQGFFRAGKQQWQEGTSHEHHEWGIKLHRWLWLQHLSWQPSYHCHSRHHHFHFIYAGESPSKWSLNLKLSSAEQYNRSPISGVITEGAFNIFSCAHCILSRLKILFSVCICLPLAFVCNMQGLTLPASYPHAQDCFFKLNLKTSTC